VILSMPLNFAFLVSWYFFFRSSRGLLSTTVREGDDRSHYEPERRPPTNGPRPQCRAAAKPMTRSIRQFFDHGGF